ncbi:MOSC domain-containing protein [Noviherbaspirillum galbum]|uniref:MOSC domain-containing protein n=1 Tax=Noviherbaspirillum galbum TaxID=2709383 RepID=A0A6B3SW00_9BURK|nr:MOSC domain-containing protein [Noviherbaspirillum galbum]NEX63575.1 MOSC domain-containing protein [Noviherbaspirillum galbum]
MKILSVNVGRAAELFVPQSERMRRIVSGIRKHAVDGPVQVRRLGLDGDEQADLTVHGGLVKAVYAYPSEHYPFWQDRRADVFKQEEVLPPGTMGENLTLAGLLETETWVGDRLHAGSVILQVTEPRQPCFKFNARMGFSHASKLMLQSGFTGFYLRVIQEGELRADDPVRLEPGPRQTSIAQLSEQRRKGRQRDLF